MPRTGGIVALYHKKISPEALLMGEFLFDKAFGQALLSLRILDSRSARIIAATASVVDIDSDLSARLGTPQSALSNALLYELHPPFEADSPFVGRVDEVGDLSLSPVSAVPQKYQFAVRVFYGLMLDQLVNLNIPLLERELLYQIADERALAEKALDSVATGSGIIETIVDESSPVSSPTFFVKAIRRDTGALLAQSEVGLRSEARNAAFSATSQAHISPLGADDSLAAAVRAYQAAAVVTQPEALRFQEVFTLSDTMAVPEDTARLLKDRDLPLCWRFNSYHGFFNRSLWIHEAPSGSINGRRIFDWYLDKLIPREKGDVDALKASLITIAIGGARMPDDNEYHIGPLNLIYARLSSEYTIYNNREPCAQFWSDCFEVFGESLYRSMHPVLRRKEEMPIDPYKGVFRWKEHDRSPEIVFNYSIETKRNGTYPGSVIVILDFSPMKDRLYKVR